MPFMVVSNSDEFKLSRRLNELELDGWEVKGFSVRYNFFALVWKSQEAIDRDEHDKRDPVL